MNVQQLLKWKGSSINVDESGMWNLTQMCNIYGTRPREFFKTVEGTRILYLIAYSVDCKERGIPIDYATLEQRENIPLATKAMRDKVLRMQKGGAPGEMGTWGHQKLALEIAQWLSNSFKLFCTDAIDKLVTDGEVKLTEQLAEMRSQIAVNQKRLLNAGEVVKRLKREKASLLTDKGMQEEIDKMRKRYAGSFEHEHSLYGDVYSD